MTADPVPSPRQRVAAYAVLTRDGQVLLTQMSARTRIEGRWTLPGGGIEHGEDPRDALRREVYEETGLRIEPGRLVDVHASHFVAHNAAGVLEDFHGIHLIFEAAVEELFRGIAPHVVEQDGSTGRVEWVPLQQARGLNLLGAARHALGLLEPEPLEPQE
jgi:8-oxo-dGTP pyrophosphatase MutT (NUDIX family)